MKVKATNKFNELNVRPEELNKIPKEGEIFEVTEERFKVLTGGNRFEKIFVEEFIETPVEGEKEQEDKEKKDEKNKNEEVKKDNKKPEEEKKETKPKEVKEKKSKNEEVEEDTKKEKNDR